MNAKQLPSGAWRVQITIDGERKSITRPTQKEAEYAALEYALKKKQEAANITIGKAIDDYIAAKDGVLSPSTIVGYKTIRNNYLKNLMEVSLRVLDQKTVQQAFNEEAKRTTKHGKTVSPKTLRNAHGLLAAAISLAGCDLTLNTTLPAKRKTDKEILPFNKIFEAVRGTESELPVLLACWLSLSMSEVRGIKYEAIKGNTLKIEYSVIDMGTRIEKDYMKTYTRARTLNIPPYLMGLIKATDAWKNKNGFLIPSCADVVLKRFQRELKKHGLPSMRFHDLRHLNASTMLALGIPDKYAMERGGWSSDYTMKSVYQHTMNNERQAINARIDEYFQAEIERCNSDCDGSSAHNSAHES